jgi:amidohydrolase
MRADIPGTIKFIFQPAEEGVPRGETGGAQQMVAEGALENPTAVAVFGLHVDAAEPVGQIGYSVGPSMSASDTFEVKIVGKSAHGSRPDLSIDPIVTAAQFIEALQTIRSRNLAGDEPAVISVGTIKGGERHNIIAQDVTLRGTIRTFSPAARRKVEERFRAILKGVTEANGATGEVVEYSGIPATINNPALVRESLPALQRVVGADHLKESPAAMASEDFSYFANTVPGFFYRLGQVKPGTVSGDHHTPTFLADDSAIPYGLKAMSYLLVDYLERHK